jgi:hypothetical protein
MAEYNGLPLYEANIDMNDEETGMFVISLVDYPATMSNFLAFSKERLTYEIQDEEQRKVFGLVMGANLPIYRRNPDGYEYFIVYSKETIAKMAEKYFKMGLQNDVDTMHSFELEEGITMTQMYIKDSEKGVSPKGFEEFEDGSLFAEFHVENDEVWKGIKDGTYRGFSLAGVFEVREKEDNKQNIKNSIQMKLEKIKEALRKLLVEFGTIATDKGTLVWDGEDEIKEGDAVHSVDENGNDVPVEDGDYTTEDKRIISIEGGKVVAIKEAEIEEPKEEEKEETPIETEEEPTEEPKENEEEPKEDEKDVKIKELEEKIKELEAAIEEKDAKIKELEEKSAAKSAEEEFKETKSNLTPKAEALQKKGYRW